MNYQEVKQDLFQVDDRYAFAHCISKDCKMGAGIALAFVKQFPNMKGEIIKKGTNIGEVATYATEGRTIFNLVTKEKYWNKPTPQTFEMAIRSLKDECDQLQITHLALPKIGAGLDRLNWNDNRAIIQEVFKDSDIDILVCYQ